MANKVDPKKEQRVALVTGCSEGGIGHALCVALRAEGLRVFASARRVQSIRGLQELGCEVVQLDVTNAESIQAAVALVVERAGHIDLLINNAGLGMVTPVLDGQLDAIRSVFDTNVFSVVAMVQAVAPHMVQQRSGVIANVGSIVGYLTPPFRGFYAATKSAVHSLSEALRLELAPFNVSCTCVVPGGIVSNIASNMQERCAIRPSSLYTAWTSVLQAAISLSQTNRPTPSDVFARRVVRVLLQPRPPAHYCYGRFSWTFRILSMLPRWVGELVMTRRYALGWGVAPVDAHES